ncbi:zf-TFIIB domain-containing protein [Patescibacteria group bacterium]|nr:zf-TFIIB domain-containing protein [Patescibacteria group bacterium]
MNCPNDNTQLLLSERQGVEIDYCPQCRGVWLDRGELDKLIEKTSAQQPAQEQVRNPQSNTTNGRQYDRDDDDDNNYNRGGTQKHKSMLGELFDF